MNRAALALAVAGGTGMSTQFFVNGALGEHTDSAELAATASNGVASLALVVATVAAGGSARALARWRAGHRPRAWHIAVGLACALPVIVSAAGAAKLGVALLTVALVAGQTLGSLVIDRVGLSPGAVHHLTAPRVAGAVLAVAAVGLGLTSGDGELAVGLLALAVLGGATIALAQAALGHLAVVFDDDLAGSAVLVVASFVSTAVVWLVVTGGTAPDGWDAPAHQWVIGGLIAAAVTVVMTRVVALLGVLRLTLGLVAGQSAGALVLDLVAPADGRTVGVVTVVQLLLVLVAVRVSGLPASAGRRRAVPERT